MKVCENCGGELERLKGIYDLDFGFVCFNCYEKIRELFDFHSQYPKCKDCGHELSNIIEMEYKICSKCILNSFERNDNSCFQQEY